MITESGFQTYCDSIVTALRKEGPVIYLESQSRTHPESRKSFIAGRPQKIFTGTYRDLTIETQNKTKRKEGNIWELLKQELANNRDWYFGYLGYDLKNGVENLKSENPDEIGAPDLFLMIPGVLAEVDPQSGSLHFLRGDIDMLNINTAGRDKSDSLSMGQLKYAVNPEEYYKTISAAKELIKQGDLYEINLAHQSKASFKGDAFRLYKLMRENGPVPFGAYINYENLHICSSSPERFLAKRGKRVFSQPIKGTSGRGRTDQEDRELIRALSSSGKEQAENLMIVDLVRHDLNKIARKGTVRVPVLFEIQTFSTVHQMVSTIEAETEAENPIDIIKACFPMGSMTGAPKIRAMQRIEELEQFKRDIYSGAIGYISPEHDFDFNVVIRSAVVRNNTLYYAAGGAITSDSDVEKEWEETLLKKEALSKIGI